MDAAAELSTKEERELFCAKLTTKKGASDGLRANFSQKTVDSSATRRHRSPPRLQIHAAGIQRVNLLNQHDPAMSSSRGNTRQGRESPLTACTRAAANKVGRTSA